MRTSLAVMALVACARTATASDLAEIYALAIEHDTQLRAAHHEREALVEAWPLARAVLLPQAQSLARYGIERTEIESRGTSGELRRVDTTDPYDITLDLRQVIFDMDAFVRLRQAGDEVAAAELAFQRQEQATVLRAASAYFGVLAAEDDRRFAQAESDALARQREQADGRFRAGIAAYVDVQEAQAQFDLAQAAIAAAELNRLAARQALAIIVGRADTSLAPLRDDIPLPAPEPPDVEAWVAAARDGNLDVRIADLDTAIAAREVVRGRAAYLPRLHVDASQSFGKTAGFNRGEVDARGVGLNLVVPLFEGLGRPARVRQVLHRHSQQQALREGVERRVEHDVRVAFLGVTAGAAQVRALRQAVASNRTALEASETGLRIGTRTIVDVLHAQRLLFGAERDLARSRYDYLLSVLALKQGAGRLRGADLDELNALLVTAIP